MDGLLYYLGDRIKRVARGDEYPRPETSVSSAITPNPSVALLRLSSIRIVLLQLKCDRDAFNLDKGGRWGSEGSAEARVNGNATGPRLPLEIMACYMFSLPQKSASYGR